MKEFVDKLIERLAENRRPIVTNDEDLEWNRAMYLCTGIVNQLAEEYKPCHKPCTGCEEYDLVRNHCPKFCKVIKETVKEIEENNSNDFCVWKSEKDMFIQNPHTGRKFSNEPSMRNVYCNTCGKKIKVAPYQPKGEQL